MSFAFHDVRIPREPGHAVSRGWLAATGGRPAGVTWHWTATRDLAHCRRLLGGAAPERRGVASAHYCVGRSFAEGVDRYVGLDDRSWHAGKNQTLRWDGRARTRDDDKGARTTVGVETVNLGFARRGLPAADGWLRADSPHGRFRMRVEPWTDEQIEMAVAVGREILRRWPHLRPRDHHGHHDLCPTYKLDPSGFPFARVLRGIYDDPAIPDVWTPLWTVRRRQRALIALGLDLGPSGADGRWGERSDAALRRLQRHHGLVEDGLWTTFVNWTVHDVLAEKNTSLGDDST